MQVKGDGARPDMGDTMSTRSARPRLHWALKGVTAAVWLCAVGIAAGHYFTLSPASTVFAERDSIESAAIEEPVADEIPAERAPYWQPSVDAALKDLEPELQKNIESSIDRVWKFFEARRAQGLDYCVDELTGLWGKCQAGILSDEQYDAYAQDVFRRHLYSKSEVQAELLVICSEMSSAMREDTAIALRTAEHGAAQQCPLMHVALDDESLAAAGGKPAVATLGESTTFDIRGFVLEDLKTNLFAEVVCAAVAVATETFIGAVVGTAAGPVGTFVGACVGFVMGVGTAVAIEISALGTHNEECVRRTLDKRIADDAKRAADCVQAAGLRLADMYLAWLRESIDTTFEHRLSTNT